MQRSQKVFVPLARLFLIHTGDFIAELPDTVQMLKRRFGTRGGPFHVALGWAVRQHKPPCRIGAVAADDADRINNVIL